MWVLYKNKRRKTFLHEVFGFKEVLSTIYDLSYQAEFYEVRYFFSLGRKNKRYKLVDLLKRLGYKPAVPLSPAMISYYSKKRRERVNISKNILGNIM